MIRPIKGYFLSLSIAKKMLLGYLPLSVLTIVTAVYALSSLEKLNNINASIVHSDIKIIENSDKMIDSVLAQELYGMRYTILKSQEMKSIFFERNDDFVKHFEAISQMPQIVDFPMSQIKSLHEGYNKLFFVWFEEIENNKRKISSYEKEIKKKEGDLLILLKKLNFQARQSRDEKTVTSTQIGIRSFEVIALLSMLSILFGVGIALMMTRYISGAIIRLKVSTHQIAEGKFENIRAINNRDEIGELSQDLSHMASELKELKKIHLSTSPLTHLPGGLSIENYLESQIAINAPTAFCLCDLDNFKAYSDSYGYARGSEVIKATGQLIEEIIDEDRAEDDFIGHIGGDDFVVITTPVRYKKICRTIITKFDNMILDYYSEQDVKNGYILGKTREGEKRQFPIISISIAVVTNEKSNFRDHLQVGEAAAALKERVKLLSGSNCRVARKVRD